RGRRVVMGACEHQRGGHECSDRKTKTDRPHHERIAEQCYQAENQSLSYSDKIDLHVPSRKRDLHVVLDPENGRRDAIAQGCPPATLVGAGEEKEEEAVSE